MTPIPKLNLGFGRTLLDKRLGLKCPAKLFFNNGELFGLCMWHDLAPNYYLCLVAINKYIGQRPLASTTRFFIFVEII